MAKSEQTPAIVFLAQLRRKRRDRCDEADKEVTDRLGKDHGASIQTKALNNQQVGDKAGGRDHQKNCPALPINVFVGSFLCLFSLGDEDHAQGEKRDRAQCKDKCKAMVHLTEENDPAQAHEDNLPRSCQRHGARNTEHLQAENLEILPKSKDQA